MDVEIQNGDEFTTDDLRTSLWQYRDGKCFFYYSDGNHGVSHDAERWPGELDISHDDARKFLESWGYTVSGDVAPSEVEELRVAVRVLGDEVRHWRSAWEAFNDSRQPNPYFRDQSSTEVDRNPIAKAAVEAAKADANAGEVKP